MFVPPGDEPIGGRPIYLAQNELNEDQAANIAHRQTGGRVLGVHRQRHKSGLRYMVKVLLDGQVRILAIDGATGKILDDSHQYE